MLNAKNRMKQRLWLNSAFSVQPSALPAPLPPISHHGNGNEIIAKFVDDFRTCDEIDECAA